MADATVLQIVQDAADIIGLSHPPTAVGSATNEIRQLVALSNLEGRELAKVADWTVLVRLHSFSTVSGTAEYEFPADFDRILPDTEWDRTQHWPVYGPITPQDWQAIKSGAIGQGIIHRRYRIGRASTGAARRTFILDPTPTSVTACVFEYVSANWCINAAGTTPQSRWAADTDTSLLPGHLMVLGLVMRFLGRKGLDNTAHLAEYTAAVDREVARDRPAPTVTVGRSRGASRYLLGPWNIPDTGFGP